MFKRSFRSNQDAGRVDKAGRLTKKNSVRDPQKLSRLQRSLTEQQQQQPHHRYHDPGAAAPRPPPAEGTGHTAYAGSKSSLAPSPIVTLTVGREGRLFAAHEDVLRQAPFFEAACRDHHFRDPQGKRISLPDEEPEVFSAVLEYLYKGDYYPRLMHNRQRNSWELEDARGSLPTPRASPHPDYTSPGGRAAASPMSTTTSKHATAGDTSDATVFVSACDEYILRDTAIYCAAERYGLEELKRLALRKQGLQAGIDVACILRSATYAYAHTPDSDSRLRAHYLALIIRCRKTFKRSGTMQAEMERGGSKLYFDLFVAMCNHLDDVIDVSNARSPRAV